MNKISHYEILCYPEDYPDNIVIKRYTYRAAERLKEDKRFVRIFTAEQIDQARDLLRQYGLVPLPRNSEDEPELWMKEQFQY